MNRRGFLGAILAACAAPAVVKASSIMRIAPDRGLWLPDDVPDFVPYSGLSMDDSSARVMAPINSALYAYADDSLADAMAKRIVPTARSARSTDSPCIRAGPSTPARFWTGRS